MSHPFLYLSKSLSGGWRFSNMKQLSSGTLEKVSCGALKFRCCKKRFDILLTLLLQGWRFSNMKQLSSGTLEKVSCGALKFRCCKKRFDILLTLLLQGWWF